MVRPSCSFVLMALLVCHLAFGLPESSLKSFDQTHPSSPDPVYHGCYVIHCPPPAGGRSSPTQQVRDVEHMTNAEARYRRRGPEQ